MRPLLLISLVVAGCSAPSTPPVEETYDGVPRLPGVNRDLDCFEDTRPTPAFCDWVWATDAVYFGTITALDMVDSPAVYADGSTEVVTCDSGVANEALLITLAVSNALRGPEVDEVTFRIGTYQLDEWATRPLLSEGETMTWADEPGLVVGQPLGVALQHDPDQDIWAMPGLPLWTVVDDEIVVQDRAPCLEPPPAGLADSEMDALEDAIAACDPEPTTAAQERVQFFDHSWRNRPTYVYAAVCFRFED